MKQLQGFTLIELSIVLVIIGLLAGGVLVGRDLILAAEVRATVSQIKGFKTAMNTFKTKYGCLPADCPTSDELGFGGLPGNGNGVIDLCIQCTVDGFGQPANSPEHNYFWRHLKDANLIGDIFNYSNPAVGIPFEAPRAKFSGSTFTIFYYTTTNNNNLDGNAYFFMHKDVINSCGGTTHCPSLSPVFAYGVDSKMDDGLPLSGTTTGNRGYNGFGTVLTSAGAANGDFCISNSSTPAQYNIQNNKPLCGLLIKFM